MLSRAFYFFTYEIIHITGSTTDTVDLKNTESNITVTDWEFFYTLAVTIYSTIITLRPTRGYGTTTIQEKTDNKVTETLASPKKYSLTDYFKCRYHLTLFRMGLLEPAHVWETKMPTVLSPTPLQKIYFKYWMKLKFSIVLSYLKKIQTTCKHVAHPHTPWVLLMSAFCYFVILGNTKKKNILIYFFLILVESWKVESLNYANRISYSRP